MTLVSRGLDLALALAGAAAWALAAYVLGSRLFSDSAGGLLGVAILFSGLALVIGSYLQDTRLQRLSNGMCPHCRGRVAGEHRHRRWDPQVGAWQQPALSWDCAACGFSHSERWACPTCPDEA